MKTDKHLHVLLASSPETFCFLVGGIAEPEQLEYWAEQIFDAPDLAALFDSHAD